MRYQILNPLQNNDVDYTRSHDCLQRQRSRYMSLDNDIESLDKKFSILAEANTKDLKKTTIINGGGPRVNDQYNVIS